MNKDCKFKGIMLMRWIGYFLLFLLFLILVLIFVKIQIQVVIKERQQFVELRYLWFKYRYQLSQLFTEETKQQVINQVEKTTEVVQEKSVTKEVEVKPVEEKIVVKSQEFEDAKRKQKVKKIQKERPIKQRKVKKKLDWRHIRFMHRKFKLIYKESKKILVRLTRRIKIHELDSVIEFNVDDPMLNGCLIGAIWAVQANIFSFIRRYVKIMEHYHFDVVSQFSGNRIFMDLTCIVSIRIVDIIIVLFSSFKDLMTIKKTIRLEEDL